LFFNHKIRFAYLIDDRSADSLQKIFQKKGENLHNLCRTGELTPYPTHKKSPVTKHRASKSSEVKPAVEAIPKLRLRLPPIKIPSPKLNNISFVARMPPLRSAGQVARWRHKAESKKVVANVLIGSGLQPRKLFLCVTLLSVLRSVL
jgi:hypothetical protein